MAVPPHLMQMDGPVAIYRKFRGPDGKPAFESYRVDPIDALEATAKHPAEYSFTPWPSTKPDDYKDQSPPILEVKPELLPESVALQIVETRENVRAQPRV